MTTKANDAHTADTSSTPCARETALCGVLLLAVLTVTVWRDMEYLFASPYPYGIDGYYYLAQVRSLQENGHLFRPAPPAAFAAMYLLAFVFGSIGAIKICAVAFLILSASLAYLLIHHVTKSPIASLAGFVLVLHGFMRVELLVDFLRQSLGHAWILATLTCLTLWMVDPKRRYLLGVIACLAGAALTHTLAFTLALLMALSGFSLVLLQKRLPKSAFILFVIGSAAAIWSLTALAAVLSTPKALPLSIDGFFSPTPRVNLDSMHDTFGMVAPPLPQASVLTGLLLFSALACVVSRACIRGDAELANRYPRLLLTSRIGTAMIPVIALAYSPFLVSHETNGMGLQLRMIMALGVPCAILIPLVLATLPLSRCLQYGLMLMLVLFLILPEPPWSAFPGPSRDGGAMHRAMEESKESVPRDAVIITDLQTGNMVNALWKCHRVVATRFDPPRTEKTYYRFQSFDLGTIQELEAFAAEHPNCEAPIAINGPWLLVREDVYREFLDYLKGKQSGSGDAPSYSTQPRETPVP